MMTIAALALIPVQLGLSILLFCGVSDRLQVHSFIFQEQSPQRSFKSKTRRTDKYTSISTSLDMSPNPQEEKSGSSLSSSDSLYWNREISSVKSYTVTKSITQEARIICISDPGDKPNERLLGENAHLPDGAEVVAVGCQVSDFDISQLKESQANVIFTSSMKAKEPIAHLIQGLGGQIRWIHSRSAGIDYVTSPTLAESGADLIMTNAKGCYSSTLAEYTMMAISYFAKDLPRLLKNKGDKRWEKYSIEEIRGKTLGIVGYGDIGKAAARLAKAYGMNIIALKRKPSAQECQLCNKIYYGGDADERKEALHQIMSESDYVLCAAPLTPETHKMFNREAFECAKQGSVFMNVGRGPIVDEEALIEALKSDTGGKLKGAGLDVFATEPLPLDSELWDLENILISSHNMDQTETFQEESVDFFVDENLPRFLREEVLLNPVDKVAGY